MGRALFPEAFGTVESWSSNWPDHAADQEANEAQFGPQLPTGALCEMDGVTRRNDRRRQPAV
jgi:hypothetical protein